MEYIIKPTGTRWTLYKRVKGKLKKGKLKRVTTAVNRNILVQTIWYMKQKKRKK